MADPYVTNLEKTVALQEEIISLASDIEKSLRHQIELLQILLKQQVEMAETSKKMAVAGALNTGPFLD